MMSTETQQPGSRSVQLDKDTMKSVAAVVTIVGLFVGGFDVKGSVTDQTAVLQTQTAALADVQETQKKIQQSVEGIQTQVEANSKILASHEAWIKNLSQLSSDVGANHQDIQEIKAWMSLRDQETIEYHKRMSLWQSDYKAWWDKRVKDQPPEEPPTSSTRK